MNERGRYSLDDRFGATDGTVVLTGLQAITRVLLDRQRIDATRGLSTGGVVSGYPGSPLGGLDLTLHRAEAVLGRHRIKHVPGVNEELAAAVISGTQQPHVVGLRPGIDGVFGMWYGKSPGADRCGDVFKHGNFLGSHRNGGVVAIVGDDPSAKSSSLPSHSETIFYDSLMPVLVPGSPQELLDLGVTALELSRYSGCWVGMTVLTNVADSVGSVDLDPARLRLEHPELVLDGAPWTHEQRVEITMTMIADRERDLLEYRHRAAEAFAAHNGLNRIEGAQRDAWIGFVASGKSYRDLRQALLTFGLDDDALSRHGIRLLKLGMTYPLERGITREFARGLERIVVIEEKREFIETAVRNVLYGNADQPIVVGKMDELGRRFVPAFGELTADRLAPLLAKELEGRVALRAPAAERPISLRAPLQIPLVSRTSAYCSGCPHNRSTVLPEGAVVGAGVGCHGMSYFDARLATNPKLAVVPMGSEGVPWIGLASFSETDHIFQQLGDGTFTHSGQLAVRACVAAGVNITFKILYNGYVAMTGGQDVAGGLTVGAMTRQLEAEGVSRIIVCTEDLDRYRGDGALSSPVVDVWHRDRVLEAQELLRTVPGVTVMIYDQVCAAEARRLRKRGELELPPRQVVINERVCEGCGDCSTQSNCLSVQPVTTELGRKTQIHQSSCNRDYSCLLGDCPSFVTFVPTKPVSADRAPSTEADRAVPAAPAEPARKATLGDDPYSIYMVGIGGTGVVTVNHVLATAALLDGHHSAGLDQTGMSQKAGQVSSHLQLSTREIDDRSAAVSEGAADVYLVFDVLSGAADHHLARVGSQTAAIVSTSAVPTQSIVTDVDTSFPDVGVLVDRIASAASSGRNQQVDAVAIAEAELGDHVLANVVLLGVAYQAGMIPLSAESIERAIELNGVAVDKNLTAFRLGRAHVAAPGERTRTEPRRMGAASLEASRKAQRRAAALLDAAELPADVRELCEPRAADLVDYQDVALARRYVDVVQEVASAEAAATGTTDIARAVARSFHKLLAYKDEYEVARLHLAVDVAAQARESLGVPVKVRYHLHPPVLRSLGMKRKLELGEWVRPAFRVLRSMRRLRGTPLDVFGMAELRKIERSLPEEYLAAVRQALTGLSPETADRVRDLASSADLVRGYEHVKLASVERFRAALAAGSTHAPGAEVLN